MIALEDGVWTCDHTMISCDDGSPCTVDHCDPISGQCRHRPDFAACQDFPTCAHCDVLHADPPPTLCLDSSHCDAYDQSDCLRGVCARVRVPSWHDPTGIVSVTPRDLDLPVGVCRQKNICSGEYVTPCPSADCATTSQCSSSGCDIGECPAWIECDDAIDCTVDSCSPAGCLSIPVDGLCDDDDPATFDRCTAVGCEHVPGGYPPGADCSSNSDCPVPEQSCSDFGRCVPDSCASDLECAPAGAHCDADGKCRADCPVGSWGEFEYCGADGRWQSAECTKDAHCDDGVACTLDNCLLIYCSNLPNGWECDDDNPWTVDTCTPDGCEHEDFVPCLSDAECPSLGACRVGVCRNEFCVPYFDFEGCTDTDALVGWVAGTNEVFVDPEHGNDVGPGTRDLPYRTVERARTHVRARNIVGGLQNVFRERFDVVLLPGTYASEAGSVLELDSAADSGVFGSPVVWRADVPGTAIVSGARELEDCRYLGEWLAPVPFDPWSFGWLAAQIQQAYLAAARDELGSNWTDVVYCPLPIGDYGAVHGVVRGDALPLSELVVMDEIQPVAAWPDLPSAGDSSGGLLEHSLGFTRIAAVSEDWTEIDAAEPMFEGAARELFPGTFAFGHWLRPRRVSHERVQSNDVDTIRLFGEPEGGLPTTGYPFRLEHSFHHLDVRGEYFVHQPPTGPFDVKSSQAPGWVGHSAPGPGIFVVWPFPEPDAAAPGAEFEGRVTINPDPLIRIGHLVSHVRLEGLTVRDGRSDGIRIGDPESHHNRPSFVQVRSCDVANVSRIGVSVTATDSGVLDTHVRSTGSVGIAIRSHIIPRWDHPWPAPPADFLALELSDNYVLNCLVEDAARWTRWNGAGIDVRGVGILVAHNEVRNTPVEGMRLSGPLHRIEFNEITDVLNRTDARGAIHTERDWLAHGTVIRYNDIHDVAADFTSEAGWFPNYNWTGIAGIQAGQCTSGLHVYGNTLEGIHGWGFDMQGGHFLTVEHNAFADVLGAASIRACADTQDSVEPLIRRIQAVHYADHDSPISNWANTFQCLAEVSDDSDEHVDNGAIWDLGAGSALYDNFVSSAPPWSPVVNLSSNEVASIQQTPWCARLFALEDTPANPMRVLSGDVSFPRKQELCSQFSGGTCPAPGALVVGRLDPVPAHWLAEDVWLIGPDTLLDRYESSPVNAPAVAIERHVQDRLRCVPAGDPNAEPAAATACEECLRADAYCGTRCGAPDAGQACLPDYDDDGIPNASDDCPYHDENKVDCNDDGVADVCYKDALVSPCE